MVVDCRILNICIDEIDNVHINENIDDETISRSDQSLDEFDNLDIHKKEEAIAYNERVISRNPSKNVIVLIKNICK